MQTLITRDGGDWGRETYHTFKSGSGGGSSLNAINMADSSTFGASSGCSSDMGAVTYREKRKKVSLGLPPRLSLSEIKHT